MDGLLASDIVVRFGGLVALDGVSLEAPLGRITGLIGPNGAGKTTLFNACCGFEVPQQGTVQLDGVDITRFSPAQRARLGIGRTFQRMELFRSLTVRENVEYAAEAAHIGADPFTQLGLRRGGRAVRRMVREAAEKLLDITALTAVADRAASELSTGQGRLLELARALARRPRMLLLDEPSSGLDPSESRSFGDTLISLCREQGLGILMVEHDIELVLRVCSFIHVIDFGRPLMAGTPDDVRTSPLVRDAYLGSIALEAG